MLYEDQFVGQGLSCQQKRKINFYPFTHFILSSVKIGALHIMFSERERESTCGNQHGAICIYL